MAKEKIKYWDIYPILSKQAQYNIILGERSNGKTYGTLKYCLEEYFSNGDEFAYIRRWDEDLVGKKGESLFNGLIANGVIKKLSKGKYNTTVYKSRAYYLALEQDGKIIEQADKPFAYAFALTQHEHYKSNSYPRIRKIIFDEFLTRGAYLPDEFIIFQNVLSTIIRLRDDVIIFMLGNTVNKYSPYVKEMGLYRIQKQEKGTIDTYRFGETGLTVAVEYSDFPVKQKRSNIYFAFNNPRLNMIKNGAWEIDIYPHYPRDIYKSPDPNEILYTFFIIFEGQIIEGDIISKTMNREEKKQEAVFLFFHPKTTPLKKDNTNLVYQQDASPLPYYRRKITKQTNALERRIARFFAKDKVFYSDNETGEIIRNYLIWCKS